jgi:hypothetical protein
VAVVGAASHAGPMTDPLSDALRELAGPVADRIGLQATFAVAGTVPIGVAVVATFWARLPQDEIAHPLD